LSLPSPVQVALARQYLEAHNSFGQWAVARKLPVLPTLPAYVADFVRDSYPAATVEALIAATDEVSRLHTGNGLADPVTCEVTAVFQSVGPIAPPRSWPAEQKSRFLQLPYGLQIYFAEHETKREKEIRRTQNAAALARQELEKVKNGKTVAA
jgi:hypothetical protein